MSAQANYFKIGLFVVVASVIGVVSILVLGAGSFFQKKVLIETYFVESVQGLEVGAPLQFRGVRVGKTTEITLVGKAYNTDRQYVLIRAALFPDMFRITCPPPNGSNLNKQVEKGLRIRLSFQGLTGSAHLEMDYMNSKRYPPLKIDWKPEYCYIPSAPSTIQRLSVAVDKILKNLGSLDFKTIATNLNTSLTDLSRTLSQANLGKVSGQAQALLSELRETNRQVFDLLKNPKIKSLLPDAAATMAASRRILEGTEKPMSQLRDAFKKVSAGLDTLSTQMKTITHDTTDSAAHLKTILRRVDDLISDQQPDIEAAIENIRRISENLREITENARKYPSQVLFGEPPPHSKTGER
ncbi:MAG: MlaD family protein [Desulfobacterales bacterium]|jgi:phospholipid/cholesterol/gamma-HCH transport system substrate-binding protein/paraquat-inducible protein B